MSRRQGARTLREGAQTDNDDYIEEDEEQQDETYGLLGRRRRQKAAKLETISSAYATSTMMGIPKSYVNGIMWCVVFGIGRGGMYSS